MLALTFQFLVLLNSVMAIIPSSQLQVGQAQQQNNSRTDPLSGGSSSETINNSVATASSTFTSVTSASFTGSEHATGIRPSSTVFRASSHTFAPSISASPSNFSSTSFTNHTSSSLMFSSSGSKDETGAMPSPTTLSASSHTSATLVLPGPPSFSFASTTFHSSYSSTRLSSGSEKATGTTPLPTVSGTSSHTLITSASVSPHPSSFSSTNLTIHTSSSLIISSSVFDNATGTIVSPTISRASNHTFITSFPPNTSSFSSTSFTRNHTSSSLVLSSSRSIEISSTMANITTAFPPIGTSIGKISASPSPTVNHPHLMPVVTPMASTSGSSELHATSNHVVCKKSGSCSPAPTTPTSRKDKKLQVSIKSDEDNRNRTDATKIVESTRTSGASADHSRDTRPTESAPSLPFGDIGSTNPSNTTDSAPQNGTMSAVIPTPGTSATPTVIPSATTPTTTTTNPPGQLGLTHPSAPTPRQTQSPRKPHVARNKNLPLIVGIAIGSALLLGVVVAVGYYLFKKRRRSRFRYNDKVPLDFSRIDPPGSTTANEFQRAIPLNVFRTYPQPASTSNNPFRNKAPVTKTDLPQMRMNEVKVPEHNVPLSWNIFKNGLPRERANPNPFQDTETVTVPVFKTVPLRPTTNPFERPYGIVRSEPATTANPFQNKAPGSPGTMTNASPRKKVIRKPPPPLKLSVIKYTPAINLLDVNKPLPTSKPGDASAEKNLIDFESEDNSHLYGIAI